MCHTYYELLFSVSVHHSQKPKCLVQLKKKSEKISHLSRRNNSQISQWLLNLANSKNLYNQVQKVRMWNWTFCHFLWQVWSDSSFSLIAIWNNSQIPQWPLNVTNSKNPHTAKIRNYQKESLINNNRLLP